MTVTTAPTTYSGVETMKFVIDGTVTSTPLIWDMRIFMPKNKSLTFNVPMYAVTGEGITAAIW